MWYLITLGFYFFILTKCEVPIHLKGFDDSILFKINWPGNENDLFEKPALLGESLLVTSHEKESYECILPTLKNKEQDSDDNYTGPNPIELLRPTFESSPCSSLLEAYWTYELCHGSKIRQYHEDREGKKFKLQEFVLGRWDKAMTAKLSAEFDRDREAGKPLTPPLKKLDGISLPYLQLNYTDGTMCDLNGQPRRTAVLYVCFAGTKNDIFVIKETSICEYEAIVISSELCKHPKYRPQMTGENEISCRPTHGSPRKPLSLAQLEHESFKRKHFGAFIEAKGDKMFAVYSVQEYKDEEGRMQVRVELRAMDPVDRPENRLGVLEAAPESPTEAAPESPTEAAPESPMEAGISAFQQSPSLVRTPQPAPTAPDIPLAVQDFLSGKDCIEGGSGWWKYKFCYGNFVEQYHIEKLKEGGVRKNSVSLGKFDLEAHLDWLKRNPHKGPKPLASRTYISHFYGKGDICEQTGNYRETEVKLKCVENRGTVSIYLLEPHLCQYILGVESPLVCEFLDQVDESGLVYL